MVTETGNFTFKITDAFLAENTRPGKSGLIAVLAMHRVDNPQECGEWEGDLSDEYVKATNMNHKTWLQLTLENLGGVGLKKMADSLAGKSFAQVVEFLPNIEKALKLLIGKEIPATVTKWEGTDKTIYQIKYIGESKFSHKPVDVSAFMAKFKADPTAAAGAPAPAATVDDDPFASGGEDTPF
jgi:hypothetical protein